MAVRSIGLCGLCGRSCQVSRDMAVTDMGEECPSLVLVVVVVVCGGLRGFGFIYDCLGV